MKELVTNVKQWLDGKGISKGYSTPHMQLIKMVEEVGEVAEAVSKRKPDKELMTEIGDVIVTAIAICNTIDSDLEDCLDLAYNKIKGRTGKTVGGVFVKDA